MSTSAAKMGDRFRWWVFRLLSKNPRVCNASTGCWAAWRDPDQVRHGRWRVSPACIGDATGNGRCWCGKLDADEARRA